MQASVVKEGEEEREAWVFPATIEANAPAIGCKTDISSLSRAVLTRTGS